MFSLIQRNASENMVSNRAAIVSRSGLCWRFVITNGWSCQWAIDMHAICPIKQICLETFHVSLSCNHQRRLVIRPLAGSLWPRPHGGVRALDVTVPGDGAETCSSQEQQRRRQRHTGSTSLDVRGTTAPTPWIRALIALTATEQILRGTYIADGDRSVDQSCPECTAQWHLNI